jgi:uncharacterized RDD family membrane protein YckC
VEQNQTAYGSSPAESASITTGKADLGKRIIAAIIDAVVGAVLGMIPVIGWLIGSAYWLVRDGLDVDFMKQRSLGKKVMKLRPVRLDGGPMNIETSIRRNWPFAIGGIAAFIMIIPVLGWILGALLALIGLGVGIVEIVLVITDPEGRRLGDKTAATKVVESVD